MKEKAKQRRLQRKIQDWAALRSKGADAVSKHYPAGFRCPGSRKKS